MAIEPAHLSRKLDLAQSLNRIGNPLSPASFVKADPKEKLTGWSRSYVTHRIAAGPRDVVQRFRRNQEHQGAAAGGSMAATV